MRPGTLKVSASIVLAILIVGSLPFVGLTERPVDDRQGVVIDFGYWDASWTDMSFSEGQDALDVLEAACEREGYSEPVYLPDGSVYSVNGQTNLPNASWNLFLLRGSGWEMFDDPSAVDIAGEDIVCWARSSDAGNIVPCTDASGHTFYSYAREGESLVTGKGMRVVSLAPSVTEVLCSVGCLTNIVGTDGYSDHPDDIVDARDDGSVVSVGGYIDPNYERIIGLAPNLVFCDGSIGEQVSMADRLRKSGIGCVILYDCKDIASVYDNIWIVASAMGFSDRANSTISGIMSSISVTSGIVGDTGKRVFVSLSADPSPWTSGSDTYLSDVISASGGTNVFDTQSSSWFMVSKEQVYAKQPDVIVIILENRSIGSQEEYTALLESLDPVWRNTPAYRNGEVYVFTGSSADVLSRYGPRVSEAVELMSKILDPSAFTDRDPMDIIPKYFGDDYGDYLRYQEAS